MGILENLAGYTYFGHERTRTRLRIIKEIEDWLRNEFVGFRAAVP